MEKLIVPLIILSFGSSLFLMFGFWLLLTCSDHEPKDVKFERRLAAGFITLSLLGWFWFYKLLT
jgi:hypothetical protein